MKIKILLAEDHVVVREAFKQVIEKEDGFTVIAEAGDGREAVRLARKLMPDVVIMDLHLPRLNGIEATRQIVRNCQNVKVLPLSVQSETRVIAEVLRAGAMGYMLKKGTVREMVKAIQMVAEGQIYLSPEVASTVVTGFLDGGRITTSSAYKLLTAREREVLQLLAEGKTVKDIGAELSVSISTVETHRRQLKTKLKMDNLADLVKFAIKEGITSL